MGDKTGPVYKPEKRNDKQHAHAHKQSGQQPDSLLMLGQIRFSPVNRVL